MGSRVCRPFREFETVGRFMGLFLILLHLRGSTSSCWGPEKGLKTNVKNVIIHILYFEMICHMPDYFLVKSKEGKGGVTAAKVF